MKTVGVLALQGDFEAHGRALTRVGAQPVYVRTAEDLDAVEGLIIPGGESTTMLKLLHAQNLFDPLRTFGAQRPIFGTCAGVILLASEVTHPRQESLGLMDLVVERNGYGRQIDSRVDQIQGSEEFEKRTSQTSMEGVFIRAPIIRQIGKNVRVLASYNGSPVLVEEELHLGSTFHPELTDNGQVHELFLSKL